MDRERWQQARALFDELVELAPSARLTRLEALEAADPELRVVVGQLLDADPMTDPRLLAFMMDSGAQVTDSLGVVGSTIGSFQLLRPLGSGGMGAVYLARDLRLGRAVALKLPHTRHQLDKASRDRFLREARAAAALDHPNLCAVYEVGASADGRPFIAMALCAGETLKARIARIAPLPLAEVLNISEQIARGLTAMHAAGITHGDLKPGNLMLLSDGTVKILDFGLARSWETSGADTDGLRGTLAYMAPEQAGGAPADQRSDLWSLGVVLQEMLTGLQPFRGQSELSMMHAILHDPPAASLGSRADLPRAVQDLVQALLAKNPADRPASAQAVEDRLALLQAGGTPRTRPSRRRIITAGLAAGALLTAAGLAAGHRSGEATGFRPGLLAVAPFDVPDSSLELWREGLADLLSQDLDGAGPFTTVSQRVVQRQWSGPSDAESAASLGARTNAELVLYGTLLRIGADSVRLRVTLLDRGRRSSINNLEVTGAEASIGGLADSLSLMTLNVLGRTRLMGSVRNIAFGARSLSALKEYLRGEQFYRRGSWDSAAAHYYRAIAEDGNFTLALKRMSQALSWGAQRQPHFQSYSEYHSRALGLNHGLSMRDSLLLLAESLRTAVDTAVTASALVHANSRAVDLLESVALLYPDDPEVWYDLGEARFHARVGDGASPSLAFEAFSHSAALDPGFGAPYEHLIMLALELRHPELALQYARASAALRPQGEGSLSSLIVALLESDSSRARISDTLPLVPFYKKVEILWNVVWATDSTEVAVMLARQLNPEGGVPGTAVSNGAASDYGQCALSFVLAFRGHMKEAARRLTAPHAPMPGCAHSSIDAFPDLALFGVIPGRLIRQQYDSVLHGSLPWRHWADSGVSRPLKALSWWYANGDTMALKRLVARVSPERRPAAATVPMLRAENVVTAAGAYLALARLDTLDAIARFTALPDSLCVVSPCFREKLMLARLLSARGLDRAAAAVLDRWGAGSNFQYPPASIVPAALDRAGIAERLGDTTTARDRYRFVTEVWQHADPELLPYVDAARAGLRRLERAGDGAD